MLIKYIIEAGGVVGVTPQKYTSCLFVAAPQMLQPVWMHVNGENLSFRTHLMNLKIAIIQYIIKSWTLGKMHTEMNQEVWWM